MRFEKKLIILSGDNNAKGTLMLEQNAYGTFATINVYNLPDLKTGEYAIGIKNRGYAFTRELGSMGRILARFKTDGLNLCDVHCVVFDNQGYSPLLYGTNDSAKLWAGNMMDGLRRTTDKIEKIEKVDDTQAQETLPSYSQIGSYFFDIVPTKKDFESLKNISYDDSALAEVNYYETPITYSDLEYAKQNQAAQSIPDSDKESVKNEQIEPWRMQRDYLSRKTLPSLFMNSFKNDDKIDDNNPVQEEKGSVNSAQCHADNDKNSVDLENQHMENSSQISSQNIQKNDEKIFQKTTQKPSLNLRVNENNVLTNALKPQIRIVRPESTSQAQEAASSIPPPSSYRAEDAIAKSTTQTLFYEQVKSQLDELFKQNKRYDFLEGVMPGTKWTKVDYDDSGKYYVVGIIGGDTPQYLCYGVPAKFSSVPPEELDGFCQWLPLDSAHPEGEGFWLMFQDAATGESIESTDCIK